VLDDAALAWLVGGATVLVHPALSEGFGYPPLEAMAAGVAVVAAAGGAVPEVAGDAALLVEADDALALARGVERLVDDPALRRDLAARGAERSRAFPPAEAARRTIAALERATGRAA
jgi:glycosyltransferase involved in cell wall biosynthesis